MAKTRLFGVDSDQPELCATPATVTWETLVTHPTGSRKPPSARAKVNVVVDPSPVAKDWLVAELSVGSV